MSLEQFWQQVIEFVRVHESWAAPIVFALAFGESLAFLSLVLPSWAALVGIGAMIRAGGVDFVPLWISGALGAAFGDWLSYWIEPGLKAPSPARGPSRSIHI
jgi:membrane protein DedA with SNARE-associated domain